jgi:orotate phosphoribosyltransferase-like protein
MKSNEIIKIKALRDAGLSYGEIATQRHMKRSTVSSHCMMMQKSHFWARRKRSTEVKYKVSHNYRTI